MTLPAGWHLVDFSKGHDMPPRSPRATGGAIRLIDIGYGEVNSIKVDGKPLEFAASGESRIFRIVPDAGS